MFMHATAHGGVRTHVRESALKADPGIIIPCRTGESDLRQRRAGPTLYQLSYISIPLFAVGWALDIKLVSQLVSWYFEPSQITKDYIMANSNI